MIDSAHRVIASIPVDAEPKRTTVSADGSRIYVTGYNGSISIINTMDYTVRTVVGDAITAEVVSPEDNYIYLAHCQGHNCWVSAMSDVGATAAVVPVDSYATALTLSPDGRRLYVASSKPRSAYQHGYGSIAVIDTATFALIDVIAMQFAPDTISCEPGRFDALCHPLQQECHLGDRACFTLPYAYRAGRRPTRRCAEPKW